MRSYEWAWRRMQATKCLTGSRVIQKHRTIPMPSEVKRKNPSGKTPGGLFESKAKREIINL